MTLKEFLEYKLIDLEKFDLTVYHLLMLLVVILVTRLILWIIKKVIYTFKFKQELDPGRKAAFYQIVKYFVIVIAITIGLETVGVKITILLAGSAALLVGVGLGLQDFFRDTFSGVILLIEGTIKVGDIIEVDGIICKVDHIGIRASQVTTRDDVIMIIPNYKFINENVVNWTHANDNTRFHLNVGVAYGSDTDVVRRILEECAERHSEVSKTPKPKVRFEDFGDSALQFTLLFFSRSIFRIENVKSDLRFMIDKEFRKSKVVIPFPQRDLHIKTDFRHKAESENQDDA